MPSPGTDEWTAHTVEVDRVESVAMALSHPQSVSDIADQARVPESVAQAHLERLVNLTVLLKVERDGETLYTPDPLHTRIQTIRDLLDEHDRHGLVELKADLQSQIDDWKAAYDVESPSDLGVESVAAKTTAPTRELKNVARDWELVQHRLSILKDALDNYSRYNQDSLASG